MNTFQGSQIPVKQKNRSTPNSPHNILKYSYIAWDAIKNLMCSIGSFRGDIVIVAGKELHSGDGLTTLYIGQYTNYFFMLNKIYSYYHIIKKQENINFVFSRSQIWRFMDKADLVIADLDIYCKIFPRKGFMEIPSWIKQKYVVPDTWEEVRGKLRNDAKHTDLRMVRKFSLRYRITKSREDFKAFYHSMYLPYIKKRFSESVFVIPEKFFLRECRLGELMQIIRGEEVISSALLQKTGNNMAFVWIGIPEGDDHGIQKGAFSALYLFTLMYSYEQGCRSIDFGLTRPLLNDGVFKYKRKWGTYVQKRSVPEGDILLKPNKFSLAVKSFFTHNLFICKESRKLVGKVLYDKKKLSQDELKLILQQYHSDGLDYLKIYSLNGIEDGAGEGVELKSTKLELFDLSTSERPEEAYVNDRHS